VLDWYASSTLVADDRKAELLTEAELEASRAFQLDPENNLALAFYAEVLLDQQKWSQAEQYAVQAVAGDPTSMDAHRVKGTVLESLGQYRSAIEEYLAAAQINPNLTFLYVYAGRNYLRLRLYDKALEFYAKAADIDEQIGVKNPLPYIEIAKTYTQQGEFFVAAINAEKALSFDPTNANTYGQLGIIYIRSRNYEGAMPVLKCAVLGCAASENDVGKVAVTGLPLTNLSVAYYYVEYGTVMAFLSTANQDYCPEARQILNQVSSAYPSDPILDSIIQDSLGICNRVDKGAAVATPTGGTALPAGGTALPTATVTPLPIPPTPDSGK
jgi:tetratricopeptide (TPR) repeat protein